MTTTLIIVRAGQTAWNKENRFRGRIDLPMDDIGWRQAEVVARRIGAEFQPAAVLSSPLQRTMQTAGLIARPLGLAVGTDEGLLDMDYGDFAGLDPAEAGRRFTDLYRAWLDLPQLVRLPHGESLEDARVRAADLIQRMVGRYPDRQVILVSHLVICQMLLCVALHLHNSFVGYFQLDTGSLSVLEVERKRTILVTVNDTCHLKGLVG